MGEFETTCCERVSFDNGRGAHLGLAVTILAMVAPLNVRAAEITFSAEVGYLQGIEAGASETGFDRLSIGDTITGRIEYGKVSFIGTIYDPDHVQVTFETKEPASFTMSSNGDSWSVSGPWEVGAIPTRRSPDQDDYLDFHFEGDMVTPASSGEKAPQGRFGLNFQPKSTNNGNLVSSAIPPGLTFADVLIPKGRSDAYNLTNAGRNEVSGLNYGAIRSMGATMVSSGGFVFADVDMESFAITPERPQPPVVPTERAAIYLDFDTEKQVKITSQLKNGRFFGDNDTLVDAPDFGLEGERAIVDQTRALFAASNLPVDILTSPDDLENYDSTLTVRFNPRPKDAEVRGSAAYASPTDNSTTPDFYDQRKDGCIDVFIDAPSQSLLSDRDETYDEIAFTIAHEAGHGFGLFHTETVEFGRSSKKLQIMTHTTFNGTENVRFAGAPGEIPIPRYVDDSDPIGEISKPVVLPFRSTQNAQYHILNNALGVDAADLKAAGYLPGSRDISHVEHAFSLDLSALTSDLQLGTLATYYMGAPGESHGEGILMRPLTLEDDGSLLLNIGSESPFVIEATNAEMSLFATLGTIGEDGLFNDLLTTEDFLGDLSVQVNGDPDQVIKDIVSPVALSSSLLGPEGLIASRSGYAAPEVFLGGPTTPIPLPASGWMSLLALGALWLGRRGRTGRPRPA